jgi:2TM family of unknown function (DUF5676)
MTIAATGRERVGSRQTTDNRPISIITLGQALSAFLIVSYTICILGYLLLPGMPVKHEFLEIFLPGFTLLTWHTFFLGLIESFLFGWYIALVLGPIYNFFLRRAARGL